MVDVDGCGDDGRNSLGVGMRPCACRSTLDRKFLDWYLPLQHCGTVVIQCLLR